MDSIKHEDFFFGELYNDGGSLSSSIEDFVSLANIVPAKHFTGQLNRFLKENGAVMLTGSSSPNFWGLLDKIEDDEIGYIKLYARTDMNDSVDATLACDVYLEHGVVTVAPQWCAWQQVRAEEIVSTLLKPLYLKGIQKRVFIPVEKGQLESIVSDGSDTEWTIKRVLRLAKGEGQLCKRMDYCVKSLSFAEKVGAMGLKGDEATSKHFELNETF